MNGGRTLPVWVTLCAFVLSWASFTTAAATQDGFVLKSSFTLSPSLAREWQLQSTPPSDHPLDIRIALGAPQERHLLLQNTLYANSNPLSTKWTYQPHLSKLDVDALLAPPAHALHLLRAHLEPFNISVPAWIDESRVITLSAVPLHVAEKFLRTEYKLYRNVKSGEGIIRALEYSLPTNLAPYVDWVQPTNYFGSLTAQWSPARAAVNPLTKPEHGLPNVVQNYNMEPVTLEILKTLYNVGNYSALPLPNNKLGITGYLENYANLDDLKQFYAFNAPTAVNSTLNIITLNGAINSQNISSIEANLDTQYAGGLSYPIPNVFYSIYGRGPTTRPNVTYATNGNEPYDVFLSYLLARNNSDLPTVLTTSYGELEEDVPLDYARSVCNMYAQLTARGVSVLHSSGDWGVGLGVPDSSGLGCVQVSKFRAIFPASCPFVTAVGGTYSVPLESTNPISGGGFSDYFPRPSYQDDAVNKYITGLGSTYQGMYNATGRGIPDISAQSLNFQVIVQSVPRLVSGTSAAAPTVAGIIALLNDALLKQGRQTLGFLNPFLYSLALPALNDITTGSNPGCAASQIFSGFNATAGWDPATGNGTPDFEKLRALITSPMFSAPPTFMSSSSTSAPNSPPTGSPGSGQTSASRSRTTSNAMTLWSMRVAVAIGASLLLS